MSNSTSDSSTPDNPYTYHPSFALAFVFAAIFSLTLIWHLYKYIRYCAWFMYFIIMGIGMECIGYWARAYSARNLKSFGSFTISYLLIMLAPSVLAAGLYQTFGRLLYYTTPPSHRTFRSLYLPARFIAPFFVVFDVVSFFIQLIGISVVVSNTKKNTTPDQQKNQQKGVDILRIGLILQTLVFGAFAVLSMRIVLISRRWQFAWPDDGAWRRLGWAVSAGSFLIFFRALYRIFEFTINSGKNYLTDHDWPAFVFDALPMLVLIVCFSFYHPGEYLPETHTSLNHSYKRLDNGGDRSQDPRLQGLKLGPRAQISVQPVVNDSPPAPQHWDFPSQQQPRPEGSRV